MVAGLACIGAITTGMAGINFGLFISPMADDLGVKQSFFGLAQTARLLGFAASGWLIGRLIDRHGARLPLIVAGIVTMVALVGMSQIGAAWQIIPLFFLLGLWGLQPGPGNLYNSVPLARWFVRNRGRAMSIAFLGAPLGILFFPPLTQALIDSQGWRTTFLVLGLSGGTVAILIALTVIRKQPQDLGLGPDGDPMDLYETDSVAGAARTQHFGEYSWTRQQAIRSPIFWRLVVILGLRTLSLSTVGLFRIPYFIDDKGFDADLVALALSSEAISSSLASIPAGWASDRFPPRFGAAVMLGLLTLAVFVTINITQPWQVFIATLLFGSAVAGINVIENALWPNYFGGLNVGGIRGLALPIMMGVSAIGAPITGLIKDTTGSYLPAWIFSIGALLFAAGLMLMTAKPAQPASETPEPAPADGG